MGESFSRRRFLRQSSAAAVTAALGSSVLGQALPDGEDSAAPTTRMSDGSSLRLKAYEADGAALDSHRLHTLIARDLFNDPLPLAITFQKSGAAVAIGGKPFQLSVRLKIPGFGEVHCYADNEGGGYARAGEIDFVVEAARTRLARVREILELAKHERATLSRQTLDHVEGAGRALPAEMGQARIAAAYAALADGLHAGEEICLARARNRISRLARPRKEFLFGAMISAFNRPGEEFANRITPLFNYATASWYYWKNEQPVDQRIEYSRMDASINWCYAHNLIPKGFGYCYMTRGATPEWLRAWPFEKIVPEYARVITQTMKRYAPRLPYVEVINEAHDKTNLWKLSHEQILEITKASCRAARAGSATVKRQINNCCLWAEYAKSRNGDASRRWSPYRYLSDCVSAGVEFEVVGLQLYYPQQDLLEIERMLDRFSVFKRPVHITEIATASVDGEDVQSMRPTNAAPGWHGAWSESTQADWLEGVYTLCYSKPFFEAVGWWDMVDLPGKFWPHGGLMHADFTPKEAYGRLHELQKRWGVARA